MNKCPTNEHVIGASDVPEGNSGAGLEGDNKSVSVIENTPWGSDESGVTKEGDKPGQYGDKIQGGKKPEADRISSQAGLAALKSMVGDLPRKY